MAVAHAVVLGSAPLPSVAGDGSRRHSPGSSRATGLGFSSFAPFGTPVCRTSVAAVRHADQAGTNGGRWNRVSSGVRAS